MFEDLLGGFDARRREFRAQETDRLNREADREFSILQAMAQHPDPEIASLGTAGILEIAGGVRPAKGLRTFFGEMERSSFYPQLKQLLVERGGAGQPTTPPQPGSAALPGSSPIEPGRQAQGPLVRAAAPDGRMGMGGPPPAGVASPGGGTEASSAPPGLDRLEGGPPTPPPGYQEPLQAGGFLGQLSPNAPPPDQMGMGPLAGPPPPPVPESPQQRFKRLYPTVGEIAGSQVYEQMKARLRAAFESLTPADLAGDPNLRSDLVRGMMGTPRRNARPQAFNADYRTADGTLVQNQVVSYDAETGVAHDGAGNPVTLLRRLPTTPPAPIRGDLMQDPSGRWVRPFFSRDMQGIVAQQEGVAPPREPPAEVLGRPFAMTDAQTGEVRMYQQRRDGSLVPAGGGGYAPPPSPSASSQDPEAVGLLAAVEREIKALGTPRFRGMPVTPVNAEMADQIVQRLSNGRWRTLADLKAATVRQPRAAVGAGGPPNMRELAGRVEQRLRRGRPDIVSGGGMPPPGP